MLPVCLTYSTACACLCSHSTRLLAATTLRTVLGRQLCVCRLGIITQCPGTKNLAEILSDREAIAQTMQAGLDEATDPWGVKVERVEM